MYKEYEITQDGLSNGNAIVQPFQVKVHAMNYNSIPGFSKLKVGTCTCKVDGQNFVNDDISNVLEFDLPAITTSKNADLVATIEVLLEEKYPGNWAVSQ